jgi:hypothetical protein
MIKIGIDIDGVLYPWHWSIYRFFCEQKGFTGSQVEFWRDTFRKLPADVIDYYVALPIHYSDTVPDLSILKAVDEISKLGEIYYITSRSLELESITRKFLNNLNLAFLENLIFEKDKATFCRMNSIDYFVDDQPEYLDKMKLFVNCYLMAVPHNIDKREGYNLVYSLREFCEIIKIQQAVKDGK